MTLVSLFSGIVVFLLAFYGLGAGLGSWTPRSDGGMRRSSRLWSWLAWFISTVVSSFIIAVVVIWVLRSLKVIHLLGIRAGAWGTYTVEGSLASNAMVTISLSLVFVAILTVRVVMTVPAVARLASKIIGESQWLVDFLEWAEARRQATIAGARWILSKIQGLFNW